MTAWYGWYVTKTAQAKRSCEAICAKNSSNCFSPTSQTLRLMGIDDPTPEIIERD